MRENPPLHIEASEQIGKQGPEEFPAVLKKKIVGGRDYLYRGAAELLYWETKKSLLLRREKKSSKRRGGS